MVYVQCIFTVRGTQSKAERKKELSPLRHDVRRYWSKFVFKKAYSGLRWISISSRTTISLQKDNKIDQR